MLVTMIYIYSRRIKHVSSYWIQARKTTADESKENKKDCEEEAGQ